MTKLIKYIKSFSRNFSVSGFLNAIVNHNDINKINNTNLDIIYLCHDNSRPVMFNGKHFSPLIDTIAYKLKDFNSITLALPFSRFSGSKTHGNTININFHILLALVKRIFIKNNFFIQSTDNDPLVNFFYEFLLKTNPKLIIGIQPSKEICIAAKKLNIIVFDVQHGIIDTNLPTSYYSILKRISINNQGWPDFILCRNELSKNKVFELSNFTKPILIGNLNKLFFSEIFYTDKKITFNNNKKIILYTLQPVIDEVFKSENTIEGLVFSKELLEIINKSNYNFIIKLHPAQIKNLSIYNSYIKMFDKLFFNNSNVEYILSNQLPLDYSMSISDLHITFNSACVFDAVDYNLQTILLDKNIERVKSYFGELFDAKFVHVSTNLDENINFKIQETHLDKIIIQDDLNSFLSFVTNKLIL